MTNDITLKSRMETINNSINNMIDEIIHDAMKNFKFGNFDFMDPMSCMYIAKGVNLLKDVMKFNAELCTELDNMKESIEELKCQNKVMKKDIATYAMNTFDLLTEIEKELNK
jgi:hypothetical protein